MDGLDKELVWGRNIHLLLTTVVVLGHTTSVYLGGCWLAVSNKRDLYNIMTANDHNVIGPVELKMSVILIKYHLTRSHSSESAADKFIVGCGIIACLDILFQTISNSLGWVIEYVSVNEPTFDRALPFVHFRCACLLLLCYTRRSVLTHLNGRRVHTICLNIALICGAEVPNKRNELLDGCAGKVLDAS